MKTDTQETLSIAELRKFAWVLSAAFVILFGLVIPWLTLLGFPVWPWMLAVVLTSLSLIKPEWLKPVHRAWTAFGQLLHRIINPLILGVVFFGLFLPLGWLMRTLKGDPLRRQLDPDVETYRIPSDNGDITQMEKPF